MNYTQLDIEPGMDFDFQLPAIKKVNKRPEGFSKTSFILYEGPSRFDGKPIVVIASGMKSKSVNEKTGAMIQTWILRQDMSPIEAHKSGTDESVCGNCKHRRVDGFNSCYVNLGQGPRAVWMAYKDGRYDKIEPSELTEAFAGRKVRLGSYGDPMAVPMNIWKSILAKTEMHTGYTHQWKRTNDPAWKEIVMASADSPIEKTMASLNGWRTFRVMSTYQKLTDWEITCPASKEAGQKTNCDKCGLCAGTSKEAKSIGIIAHGVTAGIFTLESHQMYFDGMDNPWEQ